MTQKYRNIAFSVELHRKLKMAAALQDKTIGKVAAEAVREYLDRQEKKEGEQS